MDDGEQKMYCKHCWNELERIEYREKGARTYGDVENVLKHKAHPKYVVCSKSPITDEDVINELP